MIPPHVCRPRPAHRSREQGVALVIVLWVIVILSLQVGVFTVQVRDGVRLLDNAAATARGQAMMHAVIEMAVARLSTRDRRQRWDADGAPRMVQLGSVNVSLWISDDNGRVNINRAEPALIVGLLRQLGSPAGEAQMLADRIVDWRDPDQDRRAKGAEDRDYRSARLEYGAADQPFLDASDLVRVLGMPVEVAQRLMPHVTIYTAEAGINLRIASETVVRALPNVDRRTLDEALKLLRQGGDGMLAANALLGAARQYLSSTLGPAYRIRIETTDSRRQVIGGGEAIIMVGLDTAAPYRTLAWRFRAGTGSGQGTTR